jgi:hypothetical protein
MCGNHEDKAPFSECDDPTLAGPLADWETCQKRPATAGFAQSKSESGLQSIRVHLRNSRKRLWFRLKRKSGLDGVSPHRIHLDFSAFRVRGSKRVEVLADGEYGDSSLRTGIKLVPPIGEFCGRQKQN